MLTILVEGWWDLFHSYAIVNRALLKCLLSSNDLKFYFRPAPYFNSSWKPAELLVDDPVVKAAKGSRWRGEHVDAVWRVSFPYDISHPPTGATAFVFMTAEFGRLSDRYFVGGSMADFVTSCAKERIVPIVPSEWCAEALRVLGIHTYHIVPHGVNADIMRPRAMDRDRLTEMFPTISPNDFVFLHVGNMLGCKGINVLIKAFEIVRRTRQNAKLLLKGFGALYGVPEELRQALGTLSEDDRSAVTYFADELSEFDLALVYNAGDCYVAPYAAEGFCIPVLEAVACGLPVVATKGGVTDEFLPPCGSCWLGISSDVIPVPDPEGGKQLIPSVSSLADQMTKMMDHPRYVRSAVLEGTVHVRKRYTWEVQAAKLKELFVKRVQERVQFPS